MSSTEGPLPKRRKTDQPANDPVDTTSNLPHLNDECLVAILQWLPLKKKIQFERVSQRWNSDKLITKSFANEKSLKLSEFLPESTKWHSWMGGWHIFRSLINRVGPHLITLDLSRLKNAQFGRSELSLLATKCPNLRHLHIRAATASPFALRQMGIRLNQLESLVVEKMIDLDDAVLAVFYSNVEFGVSSLASLKRIAIGGIMPGAFLQSLPNSIISINFGTIRPQDRDRLVEFLRSHPGLEQFEIDYDRVAFHNPLLLAPTLLAQYCSGLTSLRIYGTDDYLQSTATALADGLRSLTQLKSLDIRLNHNVTDSVLQSFGRNCPNLEVLRMGDCDKEMIAKQGDLSHTGLMHIGELKKLKCLELHWLKCDISDEFVTKLCEGSGATLEEVKFNSDSLTDASLHQLGVSCGNLVELNVRKCGSFTQAGVKKFIEAIISQPSWMDQRKNRHLIMFTAKLNFTAEFLSDMYKRRVVIAAL